MRHRPGETAVLSLFQVQHGLGSRERLSAGRGHTPPKANGDQSLVAALTLSEGTSNMIQLPICPVCSEPVTDQPAENWTSAYRGGSAPWWHLADNTPICAAADGSHAQAAFVEDGLPADSETSSWIDAMSHLFAIDGPCDPARLGSAITAAEHLTRWLHTATGPLSAMLALPTPCDVASLVGHLHRTTRLLARVHAQTGSYLLDQARQAHFTGLDDDSEVRGEVVDVTHDVGTWLQIAANWSAQAAQETGAAWSSARTVAALTATSAGRRDEKRSSSTAAGTEHQEDQQ
ncbi:hypothetical protein AB0H28_25650 [Micromonospora sp. NPDC050980]|uniref:hypothetical protein n=1 Tax=Micromonospora sp. NPDC050980 TaxID=3155161 RepID=UPI0033C74EA0